MIKTENIYVNMPANLDKEFIEVLAGSGTITIERIISKGHQSPASDWYDQEKNEWVLLLKGSAELTFSDQTVVRLKEGDFLHIPPHMRHKVSYTDPDQETFWLAVFY